MPLHTMQGRRGDGHRRPDDELLEWMARKKAKLTDGKKTDGKKTDGEDDPPPNKWGVDGPPPKSLLGPEKSRPTAAKSQVWKMTFPDPPDRVIDLDEPDGSLTSADTPVLDVVALASVAPVATPAAEISVEDSPPVADTLLDSPTYSQICAAEELELDELFAPRLASEPSPRALHPRTGLGYRSFHPFGSSEPPLPKVGGSLLQ